MTFYSRRSRGCSWAPAEDDPLDRLWSLVNLLNGKADRNPAYPRWQRGGPSPATGRSVRLGSALGRVGASSLTGSHVWNAEQLEFLRDHAAELYAAETGLRIELAPWSRSMVNHRALTAALVDSRDDLSAKQRAETQVLLPAGLRIASRAGPNATIMPGSGTCSTRCEPSTRAWRSCMADGPEVPS